MKLWVAMDKPGSALMPITIWAEQPSMDDETGVYGNVDDVGDLCGHIDGHSVADSKAIIAMALQLVRHQHGRELQPGECLEIEVGE